MDVKKDFFGVVCLLFSSKEGAMLKAFKILLLTDFSAHLVLILCKRRPHPQPQPTDCRKEREDLSETIVLIAQMSLGVLPVHSSVGKVFLLCCSACKHQLGSHWGHCCFSLCLPGHSNSQSSSNSPWIPLCYHTDPFPCCSNRKILAWMQLPEQQNYCY